MYGEKKQLETTQEMPATVNNGLYEQDLTANDPENVFVDEIHKALSEKNYKSLLQSNVAAYNLKKSAQKYLKNNLDAQGLGTQGYGTTAHLGIENQAHNLYAQNLENYSQREADALAEAQERKRAEEETAKSKAEQEWLEEDNQLVSFLNNTDGSDEQIAEQMDKYGYVMADDGVWYRKDAEGNPDKSSPASKYVQSYAAYIKRTGENAASPYGQTASKSEVANAQNFLNAYATSKDAEGNPTGYGSVDELKDVKVNHKDDRANESDTMDAVVGNELNELKKQINGGYVRDGTLFRLQRKSGYGEAYLVLYLGGKLYLVSTSDDEKEGGEVATKYNQYTGPKVSL